MKDIVATLQAMVGGSASHALTTAAPKPRSLVKVAPAPKAKPAGRKSVAEMEFTEF